MEEKYYETTSSLVIGIIFLVLGIVLLIGREQMYHYMVSIVVFVLLAKSFLNMVRFFFRKKNCHDGNQNFLSSMFHLFLSFLFCFIPNLSLGIVPFLFAIYLIIIGFSRFIMCFVSIKNGEFLEFTSIFMGIIYIGIAVPILKSPVTNLDTFLICFSFYVLLLGGSFLYDFMIQSFSIKEREKFKRSIRITLPKIVESIIPYSVMMEINRNLEEKSGYQYSYCFDLEDSLSDLNILIHTSNRGMNRMGHIDIFFEGNVISYGNYDEGSRRWKEIFGDGVLFITKKYKEYINFCIDNSKKTVFDFGIRLSEKQKRQVREKIKELLDNTVSWNFREDKKYSNGNSYAAKLYKKTNAKFYKFKKGKYKTYFVLGTNCCFLVDDVVGKSGMDILSMNGIITPGTYYDYLNRKLKLKKSNVISKEIYNFDRRAK